MLNKWPNKAFVAPIPVPRRWYTKLKLPKWKPKRNTHLLKSYLSPFQHFEWFCKWACCRIKSYKNKRNFSTFFFFAGKISPKFASELQRIEHKFRREWLSTKQLANRPTRRWSIKGNTMTPVMEDPPANDNYSRKFARLARNEAFFFCGQLTFKLS